MPNENCLEGFRCPECGHEDDFMIDGTTTFSVEDAGTGDTQDVHWDDHSFCACGDCQHSGIVKDFQIDTQVVEPGIPCDPIDAVAPKIESVAALLYDYLVQRDLTSDAKEEVEAGTKDVLHALKHTNGDPLAMCLYLYKMCDWGIDNDVYAALQLVPHFRYIARRKERCILKV